MIWIVTATTWEARPLGRRLGFAEDERTGFRGKLGGYDAALIEMGMGAERARNSLDEALAFLGSPEWIVHTGFAGATQPGVASGTLLFDVWGEDAAVRDLAKQVAAEAGLPYQLGRIRSTEKILITAAEKREFGRKNRALAVDRENETVREWAKSKGLPSFAAKAVFDEMEQALPADAPASPDTAATAGYLFAHWRELPSLLNLWRLQRRSVRALAAFLEAFIPRLPAAALK